MGALGKKSIGQQNKRLGQEFTGKKKIKQQEKLKIKNRTSFE